MIEFNAKINIRITPRRFVGILQSSVYYRKCKEGMQTLLPMIMNQYKSGVFVQYESVTTLDSIIKECMRYKNEKE